MITRYSILSVLIRPEIQEKISVGLLLFNNNEVYFSYSKNKLKVSKELLSAPSYKILQEILGSIENRIESGELKHLNKRVFKIFKNSISDNTFSASYISYLSKYSNNIVSFTTPKEIYMEVNDQSFSMLFKKYIDHIIDAKDELPKVKPVEYIKTHLGDKIRKHYELNREVTHEQVQNLITPVRIDFAGRNNIDVFAQTVDMEATPVTVANHINSFIQLKTTYNENNVSMKDFIIAREPDKKAFPKQHDIWAQLRSSSILNYLDLSECEAIITYAEKHGVVPLTLPSE